MNRRHFLGGAAALTFGCRPEEKAVDPPPENRPAYSGPDVILIRFGGGVRRRETVADPAETWCPFVTRGLAPKGFLFPDVEIADAPGVVTSHSQGTLYLLTGRYDRYPDGEAKRDGGRFTAKAPTIFDALRQKYDVPMHQTLVVHGEDRVHDEFTLRSVHHPYGVNYPAAVLSLYRFEAYALRRDLANPAGLRDQDIAAKRRRLAEIAARDYRVEDERVVSAELDAFWERWREDYGDSGLRHPRGDRALTELAVRAVTRLRPRLMMINYQDTDGVHWGDPASYTRAIGVIDEGVRAIYQSLSDEARANTVLVLVPDCGRDNNRLIAVPFQHHLNSRSAREIFALVVGGVKGGVVERKRRQQIDVARTAAKLMNFPMPQAEGDSLV